MGASLPIRAVESYYTGKLEQHGPTPRGVDWNGASSQLARFDQLLAVLRGTNGGFSINDYGCGYGALLDVLRERFEDFDYCGYDVSDAMIAAARARNGDDARARFVSSAAEVARADFTVASGVFNVSLGEPTESWRRYVLATIDTLVSLSSRGVAFNALTSYSDRSHMRPDLYYADPSELLAYCLGRHSRDVALRHDYELYEFTVLMRVDGRPPAEGSSREEQR